MRTIFRAISIRQVPIQNPVWSILGVTCLPWPHQLDPSRNGPIYQYRLRRLSQQAHSAARVWRQGRMKTLLITIVSLEALLVFLSSQPAYYH